MKKGFISMSVVYSFVIIFLLLVLSIVSSNLSKVKLLNYIVDKAKEETTKSNINQAYIFGYTGASQKFVVPATGVYKIEAWGASGGGVINSGKGGYTAGNITLNKDTEIYIYVGENGKTGAFGEDNIFAVGLGASASFNGGGAGGNAGGSATYPYSNYRGGCSGGGATDIRLVSGLWNDATSLRSRIIVAGGGGGTNSVDVNYDNDKSNAGGLSGEKGGLFESISGFPSDIDKRGIGGTQTTTFFGTGEKGDDSSSTAVCNGHSGGGGGYYGGSGGKQTTGGSCATIGGGGGSSYISGYTGCNAIDSSGVHTGQPNHYSGYIFTDMQMFSGTSPMPSPNGGTQTGNYGNGFAKITLLKIS